MNFRQAIVFLGAVTIIGAAAANAQDTTPHTLDGQMQQQAQPLPPSVPPGAYREWPGTPAMATGPEHGSDSAIDSEGSGAIPALPLEVQSMNDITFITGGIGDEELAQLKASEHDYDLHILMHAPGGAFISDVDVNIADAGGANILTTRGAGPYFYAKLAPGKYTIVVNEGTQSKKFAVTVKKGGDVRKDLQFDEAGGVITKHTGTATVE